MNEEQKIYEWPDGSCCPICGCTKYRCDEIVRRNPGKGGWTVTTQIFECCDCTVHFGDPEKFSRSILSKEQLGGNSMDGFSSTEGKREIALFAMSEGTGPDG